MASQYFITQKSITMTKIVEKNELVKSEIKNATKDGLSFQLVTITPQIAREWLDSTDHSIQRRLNWPHVMYLAKEMASGNWDMNGQPIQIDTAGNVVNGQHRLNACIESQCSFTSLVVYGVETKAIHTIDAGQKTRGLNDVLSITFPALKYANETAAAIKFVYAFHNGRKRSAAAGEMRGGRQTQKVSLTKISPAEAEQFIKEHPTFFHFIEQSISVWNAGDKIIPYSIFCGLLWCIDQVNPVFSWEFFTKLSTGSDIKDGSPVHYLRKKIIEYKMSDRRHMSKGDQVALIVKCFNYYIDGVDSVTRMTIPKEVPEITPAKKKRLNSAA